MSEYTDWFDKGMFWEEWLKVCGDDQDLAEMQMKLFTRAIRIVTEEIRIEMSDTNTLVKNNESVEEFLDSRTQRIRELTMDYATEEQFDIMYRVVLGAMFERIKQDFV